MLKRYYLATFVFFALITLFRRWFSLSFWPFWVGGLVGTILPDVDHIIYTVFYRPDEGTSRQVNSYLKNRQFKDSLELLAKTQSERTKLIFHTAFFQIIFLVFAFLVVSSSGSLIGKGLVLAFSLHLSIDQYFDLNETGSLKKWFQPPLRFELNKNKATLYWLLLFLLLLGFGFLL